MEDPGDKRSGERLPVGLAIRLSYGSVDEFVEKFASNISRGGVFIRTRDPNPIGTKLSFELSLQSGEPAIRGEGVVRWIQPEDPHARPPAAAGMGIQFLELDRASRAVVERIVTLKERRGVAPGVTAPAVVAPRPEHTPTPTRAPTPSIPVPRLTPPSIGPSGAQADLSAPYRIEQGRPAPVELGIPAAPAAISRPSHAVVGIDLGTTNSCAAIVKDGRPYVIQSREGRSSVPSIVAINARNQVVVGQLAKAQLLTNPKATIQGAKRLIGRPFDSPAVQEIRSKCAYEIVPDANGLAAVQLGAATLSLEQVTALILREVKEVAQNHLLEEVNRAVITVPAYYTERQREAVQRAGALAGLRVERILNEPTAAALAYAFGRRVNQRVLVYDLGGGTFDASVLELNDNVYEVVSTGGDAFLGGVDFDARVVDRLLEAWREKTGAPFAGDRVALSRLVDAAERAKCALSDRADFPIQLPFLAIADGQPLSLDMKLTSDEIAALAEPLVDRTIDICREVLLAKGLQPKDVDEVLLVGGQSRMPLVHEKVAAFFGKKPSRAVHPDEAVALGAALLAHSLGSAEGVVLIDVLPMSIVIGLPGGKVKTILPRNTALPAKKQYGLSTARDGQTEFELVVLQGESALASGCEYVGTLSLGGLPPAPRGAVKIAVTFELGAECLLTVTARELASGRQVQAVMSTKEGASAAGQRLLRGAADAAKLETGNYAMPGPRAGGPARRGGLLSIFRRLFGKRDEAR